MFVTIVVSVQYIVRSEDEEAIKLAFYKLSNPRAQITSYVYDVIRSEVPKLELDQTFEQKEYLAVAVKRELSKTMETFGFEITNALITDISPDQRVKDAMNQINAAQRLRVAAADRAEAEKIQIVKQAEAEAESKYLAGTGIARQRKAIIDGLRQSVVAFSGEVNDTTPREVIEMMLMTQYFDTLGGLGHSSKTSTLFIPHGPGAVGLSDQISVKQCLKLHIPSPILNNPICWLTRHLGIAQ